MKRFLKSLGFALQGIKELIKTEKNARIHFVITILVVLAGFVLSVSPIEWCIISLCIALVFAAESINTSIEKLTDKNFTDYHETAKKIKDISAGGVLICAIFSVVCGAIIFLPKLLSLIGIQI